MFAPPNTPVEQVKVLRAGYAKALTSPDLIAEAKKMGLEAELIHGDEMEALAREVLHQPAEVIDAMKAVMGG
jgi:tripartite-type tricarboxylate transporter receptor subunit TctC